ncbi:protein starmaker [Drosophila tropicalis]|uniref:protein starmaker n=1 Tax=Drosophila tropicalis TaxID=46794 RepID=UPI0035ABF497
MDIPSSGAIFTLGKSHLAENTQSYFYIKNDPVKRLISGPHQSAVICESGRLFVWGENHYGQLGIGGHGSSSNSSSVKNNNNNNSNAGDIVTKPTCVKALKTLGLKICDAAFGNNWAVMLTHSNEIFFTGRNIFPMDTHVAQHFIAAQVDQVECFLIRKPFRLEEFDDYLSKNEETDNFITVQAGNEHFVVMTTTGRLIGCGSNDHQQLGELESDYDGHPVEIKLDATIQQFACGPESTLVLTASGNLFLTGRLNEFVFPKFTELQKNLSQTEQIIFMHISKTSEIYIVTNVGNIYRSFESVRNKSLVFQRFYDYDSEENGPIWKLLKGFSFYAVLSKANKFFTTFSESGHHLKTFREISKFKNLRLLDIAVGDQHVLVQGIPRSALGTAEAHRHTSRNFVLQPQDANGNATEPARKTSARNLIKQQVVEEPDERQSMAVAEAIGTGVAAGVATGAALEAVKHITNDNEQSNDTEKEEVNGNHEESSQKNKSKPPVQDHVEDQREVKEVTQPVAVTPKREPSPPMEPTAPPDDSPAKTMESLAQLPTPPTKSPSISPSPPRKSSANSMKSQKSAKSSIHFDEANPPPEKNQSDDSQEGKHLRPHTPYPESSSSSTPTTIKKTPIRNFSYEAAMDHDHLERTSPELADSLETVEEHPRTTSSSNAATAAATIQVSTPTPPTEEDEHLAVEITTTMDSQDSEKEVNEIRFINNGIDVTAKVEEQMPDTPLKSSMEEEEEEQEQQEVMESVKDSHEEQLMLQMEEHVDKVVSEYQKEATEEASSIQTAMRRAANGAKDAVEAAGERMATGARGAVDAMGDAMGAAGRGAQRMASDAIHAVEQAGSNAAKAATDTKDSMGRAMDSVTHKISSEMLGAKENISSLFQIKAAREADPHTTPVSTPRDDIEDGAPKTNTTTGSNEEDERTTASVNSNHNSAGVNGNGSSNPFEPDTVYDDPLDAVVERSKKAMQADLRAMEERAQSHVHAVAEKKEAEAKGFVQQMLDGMGLSCRNEKAVQIANADDTPHYNKNKVNSELSLHNGNNQHGNQQSSRVCTIL